MVAEQPRADPPTAIPNSTAEQAYVDCRVRPAGVDAGRRRAGAGGVLRRPRRRHPPGPPRTRHRLGRHPAPSRRPRHRRRAPRVRPPRHGGPGPLVHRAPRGRGRAATRPLVVDWRAPVAEPFYRATAVAPMGVVRRRHLITKKGREVTGLDDEVFDQRAIARGRPRGRGRRRAPRGARTRPHRPHGRHRRDDPGRAGPGDPRRHRPACSSSRAAPVPGKTAVALHRAAYLLYTHRRRLASSGVLLVGPSAVFLRYIEQVLPSLGEQDVQLSTLTGLKPRLRAAANDTVDVATLKGDGRMADVIEHAVADRERPLAKPLALVMDGIRLRITRGDTARIVEGARRSGAARTTRSDRSSRGGSSTCWSARYKEALVRNFRSRQHRRTTSRCRARAASSATSRASSIATSLPTRPPPRALARGEAPPEGWERSSAPGSAAGPRSRRRSNVAGPSSPAPSCSTTCSASPRSSLRPARDVLADDEIAMLHRRRDRDVGAAAMERGRRRADRRSRRSPRPGRSRARAAAAPPDAATTPSTPRPASSRTSGLHGFTDAASLASRYGDGPSDAVDAPSASRARSGTCSSTKPRTSPRCSGACSPAGARRGR